MATIPLILLLVMCSSLAESADCECKCIYIGQQCLAPLILKCDYSGPKGVTNITIRWFWRPLSGAMQPRALLDSDSTYQQNTNSDLNGLERNFWGSELHFTQLNYSSPALYYCCIHDTQVNASNINLAANQNGICHRSEGQKTCADFNFSNGGPQNPICIQSSHTPALHSTPSPTEDKQPPFHPGMLHSTPSPTEDKQPPFHPGMLHSTPSPTEDQQPSDPGVLHSTPSPIEDQQPPSDPGTNREKDFPPVGLTYSAIALAVVFLLTTLLIAVALAVLIWTKGAARTQGNQQYPMVACSGDHIMPQSEHQTERWRQSGEETTLHTGRGDNSDEFHPYDVLTLQQSLSGSSVNNEESLPSADSGQQPTKNSELDTAGMEGAHIYQTLEPVDEEDKHSQLNVSCEDSNKSFSI